MGKVRRRPPEMASQNPGPELDTFLTNVLTRGHRRRQSAHRDAAQGAAALVGRLAALVEDLPGEVAAALPAGALGPDDEPLVLTAMAGCLRDLPATGWHNHLAASFVRNLKSRGQCDLRSQSSPPRGLAASSDGGEVEVVWRARSALRCNAKHRRVWKKTANSGKKRPTLEIRTVCGYPSGMTRPRFSSRFETGSARWRGAPPLGNRAGFHGLSKRVELAKPSHIHQPLGSWVGAEFARR